MNYSFEEENNNSGTCDDNENIDDFENEVNSIN